MVLKSSYTKGSKIRLCTRGGVTILQCRKPILIDEDDLKYGVRDNTSGSLVFSRPKVGGARGKPLPEPIYKPTLICIRIAKSTIKNKHKCLPVTDERCVHSKELFLATIPPQEVCDSFERFLVPQG
mgnify:CR=1 FL=1